MATPGTARKTDELVEQSLYAKAEKIYPREVHGIFALLRNLAMVALLGLFYGLCWIQWDGHQAVLFDLPARKFYIFGWTFWPQDFFFLTLLLIISALALFFFTALAGRLWCGYACPQTVWTEIFLWFERKIEGSRQQQIKLDQAPMSARKFGIKASKHAVWLIFSLWTGFTFVGYFTPIKELWGSLLAFSLGPWETFWVLFYGFATYGNAGWMREQVCIYMCPYARFQSAMFDKNTLIISYDEKRGEPRGSRRRGTRPADKGDCIDCGLCVQVCPTGIDIRDGLQYQCIGCAACIDVCDDVMEKMGYENGLVKYTTENALSGKHVRLMRPRVILYSLLLLLLTAGLIYGIATRVPLEVNIIRDRNALFNTTNEGLIENVYTLKVINMDKVDHQYSLSVTGIPGLNLKMDVIEIVAGSGEVVEVPVRVSIDPAYLEQRSTEISFHLNAVEDGSLAVTEEARFLGPRK